MAFKRSRVRSSPSPPEKTTSSEVVFSVLFALGRVILLRSDIMLCIVIFASQVSVANKISLKPQVSISLSRSENIALPKGRISLKNILSNYFFARFRVGVLVLWGYSLKKHFVYDNIAI